MIAGGKIFNADVLPGSLSLGTGGFRGVIVASFKAILIELRLPLNFT